MHAVQSFELTLASLVLAAELEESGQPQATPTRKQLKAFDKASKHLVHSASAGEMHRRLKAHIPEALADEIKHLISWRNFLAHRYLRTRLYTGANQMSVSPVDVAELRKLRAAFEEASTRVETAMRAVARRLFDEDPDSVLANIQPDERAALERLVFAEPPRFESIAASGSAELEDW